MRAALLVLVGAFLVGCALLRGAASPTSFGLELGACQAKAPPGSEGWAVYAPCCVDVYLKYPLPDGGPRDPSSCYRDGGAP